MPDLIAVLGRGIYQISCPNGKSVWKPTSFLEICGDRGQHLGVKQPADDNNPDCLIGGGNANIIAALQLYEEEGAKAIVFAYGERSQYLREADGPSESKVMAQEFKRRIQNPQKDLWIVPFFLRDGSIKKPSNSLLELRNIMNFALEWGHLAITIITVAVHVERVKIFLESILQEDTYLNCGLRPEVIAAEELLRRRSRRYFSVLKVVEESQTLQRSTAREKKGIQDFREGRYKPVTSA